MKNKLHLLILVLMMATGFYGYYHSKQKTSIQLPFASNEAGEREEIKEWEDAMLADPTTGEIPKGIHAIEQNFAQHFIHDAISKTKSSKQLEQWKLRGPWNVGGRTRAFAIDITNDSVLFAGGVSGGLWRSADRGNSWTRVTNKHHNPDVVSIAQDTRAGHTKTWYYSTGEALGTSASGGGSFYLGDGIFKSVDGGFTWDSLPATTSGNPQGPYNAFQISYNLIFNAANKTQDEIMLASLYYGIQRSIDGGATFTQVLGSAQNCGYESDIAVDTNGVYYATSSSDASSVKGIFRSTNGTTWTNITPTNFHTTYGLTKIGINPSNQNEVYFLVADADTLGLKTSNVWGDIEYTGLWKYTYVSGNGSGAGGTWVNLSKNLPQGLLNFDGFHAQGGYDLLVKVHPTQPNTVFICGTNIYRSTNGFTTNTQTKQIGGYAIGTQLIGFQLYANHHPDQHDFWFLPSNPNIAFSACDGGVYQTTNCMASTVAWTKLDRGYYTTQFYTAQLHPDYTNDILLGGLQDNGIFWTNSSSVTTPWKMPFNGDGAWLDMSNDGNTYYLSIQEGKVLKASVDNTGTITQFARIDPKYASRSDYQFINQFVVDKADDKIMYMPAGRKLFRNDNLYGIPFSGNHDSIATNWIQFPDTLVGTNQFTAIACSKTGHTLYVGTKARKVYRIDNANTGTPNMNDITGSFPNGFVNCIAVDPTDANKVVVVYSNYNTYSIFYSTDGGNDWIRCSGNLETSVSGAGSGPSVRWITMMPYQGHMKYFAGTSIGLFSADSLTMHDVSNPGTQWTMEGVNEIGNTIVPYIQIREADNMVAVATHGSGVFTIHYGWNVGVGEIENTANDIIVYPNPTNDFVKLNWNSNVAAEIKMQLFDISGKQIFVKSIHSSIGKNTETIDVKGFIAGTYFLNMNDGKNNFNKKIIIQ
ncbi:MAG: hypothetical protein RJA07_1652 [Bacteroidota bacterium]|jgi:hypothetical protein